MGVLLFVLCSIIIFIGFISCSLIAMARILDLFDYLKEKSMKSLKKKDDEVC